MGRGRDGTARAGGTDGRRDGRRERGRDGESEGGRERGREQGAAGQKDKRVGGRCACRHEDEHGTPRRVLNAAGRDQRRVQGHADDKTHSDRRGGRRPDVAEPHPCGQRHPPPHQPPRPPLAATAQPVGLRGRLAPCLHRCGRTDAFLGRPRLHALRPRATRHLDCRRVRLQRPVPQRALGVLASDHANDEHDDGEAEETAHGARC